jgi:hypothetical protein
VSDPAKAGGDLRYSKQRHRTPEGVPADGKIFSSTLVGYYEGELIVPRNVCVLNYSPSIRVLTSRG